MMSPNSSKTTGHNLVELLSSYLSSIDKYREQTVSAESEQPPERRCEIVSFTLSKLSAFISKEQQSISKDNGPHLRKCEGSMIDLLLRYILRSRRHYKLFPSLNCNWTDMKSYKYLSVSSISYTNPIVVTKVINGYVTTTVSLFVKTSDFESLWIFTKMSFIWRV